MTYLTYAFHVCGVWWYMSTLCLTILIGEYSRKVGFCCWKKRKNWARIHGFFGGATYLYLQLHLLIFITNVIQRWSVMLISDFATSLCFSFLTGVSMLFIVWTPLEALVNQLQKTRYAIINKPELKVLASKFAVY